MIQERAFGEEESQREIRKSRAERLELENEIDELKKKLGLQRLKNRKSAMHNIFHGLFLMIIGFLLVLLGPPYGALQGDENVMFALICIGCMCIFIALIWIPVSCCWYRWNYM